MLDELAQNLAQIGLDPASIVVLGVSGGPDSLSLLHAMTELDYRPHVFHMNYAFHNEADAHQALVEETAKRLNLFLTVKDWPASNDPSGFETAARTARYQAIFDLAASKNAAAVLVAHNADDQVETILMHLFRGAGLNGMGGMQLVNRDHGWHGSIPLARPLLTITRQQILAYLQEKSIEPAFDPTNQDASYTRNALRLNILPTLESEFPTVRDAILRLGNVANRDNELLDQMTLQAAENVLLRDHPNYVQADLTKFKRLPLALQYRLMQHWMAARIETDQAPELRTLQRSLSLLHDPEKTDTAYPLQYNLLLLVEEETFFIYSDPANLPLDPWPQTPTATAKLDLKNDRFDLNPPWQITLQKNTQPVNPQPKLDNYETWLTFPENATLTVRSPQPGDWIAPLGMHGQHQKIGDLFTNAKVPRRARAHWPLVLVNDEVAWVVGLKTSETFRVKSDSVSVLHLQGLKTDLEN